MPEPEEIKTLFQRIAWRYDRANTVLSLGLHRYWRWRTARVVKALKPKVVLDMATGTGDLAFALERQLGKTTSIMGMDFCEPMLALARKKQGNSPIPFTLGDCLNIPLDDGSIDVVTMAFGLRNIPQRNKAFLEIHRVLRPGGFLVLLEFSQPSRWFAPLYWPYLHAILPWLSGLLTGHQEAYRYLGRSIEGFLSKKALSDELRKHGFEPVKAVGLSASVVAIHVGKKRAKGS